MQAPTAHYPDWKAPAEDGKLLIWPAPGELLRQTRENLDRLSREQTQIQNIPLNEIRRAMRTFVGHDDARPLLASGHQTELYHPGVWAKDALLHAAAKQIDGQAYHLAVDTDAPKHLTLRFPGGALPITDDPKITSASWCGLLDSPSPAHLKSIRNQFAEAARGWNFQPMFGSILDSLRRLALESGNFSSALTNAQHELGWELGLRHHALLASPIWASEPFLLFVHHTLARADRFAADYNSALQEYRDQHGMRTRSRPMPDLFIGPDAIEMPFWLDDLSSGARVRPSVFRSDRGWMLQLASGAEFILDANCDGWEGARNLSRWLASNSHRLSPRALMLTMFCRLCLVDQFTHGIGGGRYDQVTDALITRYFGIEPPKFSVTTATLYFPDAVGRPRVCVPCVIHEGHRLRHSVLGERKMQLVAQIDALPRHSHERETVFQEMHNQLEAEARRSEAVQRWKHKLSETIRQEREEQTLFDRELFCAIQPRERLMRITEQYESAFAPSP